MCRGVSGLAWVGSGGSSQHVYSVGADAVACVIDALTGKVQRKFEAGKHAITCMKPTSGD